MLDALNRLGRIIGQFRDDAKGVAAVEFALVVPVMLLLYIGSVEASSLISMDRRVQTVAGTMGDLVSRSNLKLAACDLKDYFQASSGIMAPYSTEKLQQIVTSVFVDKDGNTDVKWSETAGGATAHPLGKPYDLPKAMTDISKNAYVIVAEATYAYTPITGFIYDKQIQLYRENFYLPRFGGNVDIDRTSTAPC